MLNVASKMPGLAPLTACLLAITPAGETPSTPLGQRADDERPGQPRPTPPTPPPEPHELGEKQAWLDVSFLVGADFAGTVQPVSGPEKDPAVAPLTGMTIGVRGPLVAAGISGAISLNGNERFWGAHLGIVREQGPVHGELAVELGGHHLYEIGSRTYHHTDTSARMPYLGFHLNVGTEVNPSHHLRAGASFFGRWDLGRTGVVAKDVQCSGPLMGTFPFYTRPTICDPDQSLNVGGFTLGLAFYGSLSLL